LFGEKDSGGQVKFTRREREIVRDIAAGLTNKEIANHLRLRETTVKWYIARMLRRTGAANRAALVELFHREDD
jgi:DNA-binding NarL/FixJ family response regulator